MVTETKKLSKEENIAAMDAAAEGAGEMFSAWKEKYPEAAKEAGLLVRTFKPSAGLKRLARIIEDY